MTTSLLTTVAEHEAALMDEMGAAEAEGRDIVETAQSEATALLVEASQKLDAELAELRRSAAQAREEECARITADAAAKVQTIRENSVSKRSLVIGDILGVLIPAGSNSDPKETLE